MRGIAIKSNPINIFNLKRRAPLPLAYLMLQQPVYSFNKASLKYVSE